MPRASAAECLGKPLPLLTGTAASTASLPGTPSAFALQHLSPDGKQPELLPTPARSPAAQRRDCRSRSPQAADAVHWGQK